MKAARPPSEKIVPTALTIIVGVYNVQVTIKR
jgi:hypothetical protein